MRHYEPFESTAGTVFDPESETFGPIMASISRGDFGSAAVQLARLTDDSEFAELCEQLDEQAIERGQPCMPCPPTK